MWFEFASDKSGRDGASGSEDDGEARDPSGAGLPIFLGSLSVLFAVALFGYWGVRSEAEVWGSIWTPGGVALMGGATLALIFARRSFAYAARYAAQDRDVRPWLVSGVVGALLYGAAQTVHWRLLEPGLEQGLRPEIVSFTLLTSLHALCCVGGCVATALLAWRQALAGPGACARGLGTLERYWGFLLWVWPVLLLVLVA